VGEHALGTVDSRMLKLSTAFAGGVGGTQQELCGALSAGILIIGARHGRDRPDVDDHRCQALAADYRMRFLETFGTTRCDKLRLRHRPCASLVAQAAHVLLEILDEDQEDGDHHLRD
jgi:C_GCAxxG_C_C family probable redox protein